jgi:hypothetical protein
MELFPLLVPAGSDTEVQFNDGNLFGADSTFTFNKATDTLTAGGMTVAPSTFVFQPTADSSTALQVLDADGGQAVLEVDSTNEQVTVGVVYTVKNSSGQTIMQMDNSEFYITDLTAVGIVAGNPMGLLLSLTYPATP